jgi:DNA-binding SARP family transcriptional activator/tetratricopeptide (TPR) repeat protein
MAAAHGIRARLLGSFDLTVDGVTIGRSAFERPSGLRLLKLLLATPGHRLRREAAAEALWPEMDPERSAANLRKAMYFARRAMTAAGPGADASLVSDGQALTMASLAGLHVDADDLASALAALEAHRGSNADVATLAELGGGDLLPEDPYEEWLVPIRERLAERTVAALGAAATAARDRGEREVALRLVEVLLAREPADEAAHRLAIELHLDAGELHAARRQLQRAHAAVAETYGVELDPALEALVADASTRRAASPAAAAPEAPIVGRIQELAASEVAFDAVAAGRSASILLRGPAGIGKSRVLREIAGLARASGWELVEGRGLEASPGEPFGVIGAALRAAFGGRLTGLDEPARSAVVAAAPAGDAEPTVIFASDGALTTALVDAIRMLAAGGPTALIVDDAQWLDHGSLGVLIGAAGAVPDLLVVVTVRDDPALLAGEAQGLLDRVAATGGQEIHLRSLGPREIQALLERDVDGERVDDDLADRVAEVAAGVPLFALEVFRSARDAGLVVRRDGRWRRRRGVEALPVPAGVTRLVERRIERLHPGVRRVLATAAELGDVVAFEDLVATDVDADSVLDAVDHALVEGIVIELGGRYAFAHPLYRAALRSSLRPRDRADVHRRIATSLAGRIAPWDDAAIRLAAASGVDLAAVASHAASAVELGQLDVAPVAVGFGLAAGSRQADLFDHAGAVATLRRSLQLWQRLPRGDQPAYPISAAQVRLGEALRRTGDDTGAAAAFQAAIHAARDDDERAVAYAAAAWLPYEHGRFATALELLDAGVERTTAAIPRAILDTTRGWILGRNGHWAEAEPILLQAVETLEARGPSPELMRALDRLSIAISDRDPAGSIAVVERAMAMARELGQMNELGTYEMHYAGTLRDLGRLDEAVAALDRSRALCRRTGELYIESVTEWIAAEVEQTRGEDRRAIEHRRRELELFTALGGNPRHEALAHAHIAHLSKRLGDGPTEAFEADAARRLARHSGIPDLLPRVEWALTTDDWFADQPVWDVPAEGAT